MDHNLQTTSTKTSTRISTIFHHSLQIANCLLYQEAHKTDHSFRPQSTHHERKKQHQNERSFRPQSTSHERKNTPESAHISTTVYTSRAQTITRMGTHFDHTLQIKNRKQHQNDLKITSTKPQNIMSTMFNHNLRATSTNKIMSTIFSHNLQTTSKT